MNAGHRHQTAAGQRHLNRLGAGPEGANDPTITGLVKAENIKWRAVIPPGNGLYRTLVYCRIKHVSLHSSR